MTDQYLICTDLDRTLLPNGPQPESNRARARFQALVSRPDISLAYVSGRNLEQVRKAMHLYHLPEPDFVIGDVGTTLYQLSSDSQWQLIDSWQQHIANDWNNYSREKLAQLIRRSELRLQEHARQNRFKLSYYAPLRLSSDKLTASIHAALKSRNIKASLIWSIDEPNGIGLLDIVPASASKFHAIEYLLQYLKLDQARCVFCGDSGNDMEVLTSPIQSVLVANSTEAVREKAFTQVKLNGNEDSLYLAQGSFLDMNGNYSAGMLEGIAHYLPQTQAWMRVTQPEVQT
jgi:hypothetical protein